MSKRDFITEKDAFASGCIPSAPQRCWSFAKVLQGTFGALQVFLGLT